MSILFILHRENSQEGHCLLGFIFCLNSYYFNLFLGLSYVRLFFSFLEAYIETLISLPQFLTFTNDSYSYLSVREHDKVCC